MAMAMGRNGEGSVSEINMTPMIDVLLVLLVIFIIVQMNMQRAFDVQLPHDPGPAPESRTQIVMEIAANGTVSVNTRPIPAAALEDFLRTVFSVRPDRVIFVKAAPEVPYGTVIEYIDIARAAGVSVVGAVLVASGA